MSIEKVAMNDELLDKVSGGSVLPYVVQTGDTLGVIAKKFNVPEEEISRSLPPGEIEIVREVWPKEDEEDAE